MEDNKSLAETVVNGKPAPLTAVQEQAVQRLKNIIHKSIAAGDNPYDYSGPALKKKLEEFGVPTEHHATLLEKLLGVDEAAASVFSSRINQQKELNKQENQ
jgi:hypothetical protein